MCSFVRLMELIMLLGLSPSSDVMIGLMLQLTQTLSIESSYSNLP